MDLFWTIFSIFSITSSRLWPNGSGCTISCSAETPEANGIVQIYAKVGIIIASLTTWSVIPHPWKTWSSLHKSTFASTSTTSCRAGDGRRWSHIEWKLVSGEQFEEDWKISLEYLFVLRAVCRRRRWQHGPPSTSRFRMVYAADARLLLHTLELVSCDGNEASPRQD